MPRDEVLDMQVRIFRLGFISECYELLHVSGDECVLDDIDGILHSRGYQL